jgi:hypothetical protein
MRRLLLIALLLAAPAVALADVSPYSCKVYFGSESDVPSEAGAVLALVPGGAVKMCSIPGKQVSETYAVISAAIRGVSGVCQFTQRRVFKDGQTWTYAPPAGEAYLASRAVFMMASDKTCAGQNDPRYIAANDVSEGVFGAAVRLWERISSSGNLDTLLGNVPADVRSSGEFRSFESAIKNGLTNRSVIKLARVSRYDPDPEKTLAHYALDVRGSPNSWILVVDFTGEELRLLGVNELQY